MRGGEQAVTCISEWGWEDGDVARDCSPLSRSWYLSSIRTCIFSSFRFRTQSCPLTREHKRQATRGDVSRVRARRCPGRVRAGMAGRDRTGRHPASLGSSP